MKLALAPCVAALALLLGPPARAGEVSVAVAANFVVPLERLGSAFTAATGHKLKVSP
ncbi:MAG: molybdate ABC transporter substrate-binding protein, partial [Rubrivivax sp.]|nr:molybdate ABC transporter substrate-binding protein [Rubrivivax sp.]